MSADGTRDPSRLVVLYHHRTRSRDGQSVHIDEIIKALRQLGHVVVVVGPTRRDPMKSPRSRSLLPLPLHELLELGYSLLEFARLLVAIRRHKPDAIYERANVFMLSGIWASRLLGLPLILEVNAPLTAERAIHGGLALRRLADWSEKLVWRSASRVLAVTQVLADQIVEASVPAERVSVIPNGVDPRRFMAVDPITSRRFLGLSDGLVLGFVGFVRAWHGLDHVIDLIAAEPALSRAQLVILGDGPGCATLRARAQTAKIADRVTITGVLTPNDVTLAIGAIDIALQPDVTRYASPLKLFEYMAAGCAIVAPSTENIREILESEVDSLLFEPGDPKSFPDNVVRLAHDQELRDRLARGARRKISERGLTWAANAQRIVRIVEDLQARSGGRDLRARCEAPEISDRTAPLPNDPEADQGRAKNHDGRRLRDEFDTS